MYNQTQGQATHVFLRRQNRARPRLPGEGVTVSLVARDVHLRYESCALFARTTSVYSEQPRTPLFVTLHLRFHPGLCVVGIR